MNSKATNVVKTRKVKNKRLGFKVTVTQDHIDTSVRGISSHCMIAQAVKESYSGCAQRIAVDVATIRLSDPNRGERYIYFTPPTAQQMIVQFDRGITPKPATFRLSAPAIIQPISTRYSGSSSEANTNKGKSKKQGRPKGHARISKWVRKHPNNQITIHSDRPTKVPVGARRGFGLRNLPQPEETDAVLGTKVNE